MHQGATILDVLDNFLGGTDPIRAEKISQQQVDELAEHVVDFYDSWSREQDPGTLTAYFGGATGAAQYGGPDSKHLLAGLLYYPRVVMHDPLANWFNRDRERLTIPAGPRLRSDELWPEITEFRMANDYFSQRPDLDEARASIGHMLTTLHELRPLIESGAVIPVPPWRIVRERQNQIATAMRHDIRDEAFYQIVTDPDPEHTPRISDLIYGRLDVSGMRPDRARLAASEAPSFYQNKVLAIADSMSAVYVPPKLADFRLLEPRIASLRREVRMKSSIEISIVRDILRTNLPLLRDVTPEILVKARQNEEAFEEFRLVLSSIYRSARASSESENFPEELSETIRAELEPRVNGVRRAVSRSSTLREASEGGVTQLVLGGAGLAGAGITGSPWVALGGLTLSAISGAVLRMFYRPPLAGADVVISALLSETHEES